MQWYVAANAIALIHFAFIVFVVFGGLAVLRWPALMWVHLPAAVWGVLIEVAGWYCPLTTWENDLLRLAGRAGYSNGFVEHYLFAMIYPDGLTRSMQMGLAAVVLIVNAGIYWRLYKRDRS